MSLSVVQRVVLGFIVLLLLLFAVAATSVSGLTSVQARMETVTGEMAQVSDSSTKVAASLAQTSSAALQYLIATSDVALEGAKQQYQTGVAEFGQDANLLTALVANHPDILQVMDEIKQQSQRFFEVADHAIADHNQMVTLSRLMPNQKLDLKDALSYVVEDLQAIEGYPENDEQAFAAGLARTQMESVRLLIGDYFDSNDVQALLGIQKEMTKALAPIGKVIGKLNDETVLENINNIRLAIESEDGVVNSFLTYNQIQVNSEHAAADLLDVLVALQGKQQTLIQLVDQLRESAKQNAFAASNQAKMISYWAVAISVLIAVGIAYWVSVSIRKPLAGILRVLDRIASGDFSQQVPISSRDEFGQLASWVNALVRKLNDLIKQIDEASHQVVQSAETVFRSTTNTQSIMKEQNDKTTSVAHSMNSMSLAVSDVAERAEITLDKVQQVDTSAQNSLEHMRKTIEQVESLVEQLESSSNVVEKVARHSVDIGSILSVIQDIAEQTNLLALNAAIEAARAGEQGRGFAVVADEVRTLANRTHSSTEEIQRVINELQSGIKATVSTMGQSCQYARESMLEAQSVGQVLSDLRCYVTEIRDLSTQIVDSADRQSKMAHAINSSIHDIADSAQGAMSEAQAGQGNCKKMNELAHHQQQLMGQFKTA